MPQLHDLEVPGGSMAGRTRLIKIEKGWFLCISSQRLKKEEEDNEY